MKDVHHLDDVDRRLLQLLQADAARSHAVIGETIGASQASVWRRIKALEARGILAGVVRLVNRESIGRGVTVMTQVRMRSHAQDDRRAFEAYIAARPEIMECFSMSGEWDYLLQVVVPDVDGYERFLMRELLKQPNVATSASSFALAQIKYTTAVPI